VSDDLQAKVQEILRSHGLTAKVKTHPLAVDGSAALEGFMAWARHVYRHEDEVSLKARRDSERAPAQVAALNQVLELIEELYGGRKDWVTPDEVFVRGKIDDAIYLLEGLRTGAEWVEPIQSKRGAKPHRPELRAAVRVLADYWTNELGQEFTVTFKPATAPKERRKRGEGNRFVVVHDTVVPISAAAQFVCVAMQEIDPTVPNRQIDAAMQAVRRERKELRD
jgi:hypothetical protein